MDVNSKESLRVDSLLVIGDIKSNKYFSILYVGEPIWDIIGLYFGRVSTHALWIIGNLYRCVGTGPSGMSLILTSRVMAFFWYKVSQKVSTNVFSLTIKL